MNAFQNHLAGRCPLNAVGYPSVCASNQRRTSASERSRTRPAELRTSGGRPATGEVKGTRPETHERFRLDGQTWLAPHPLGRRVYSRSYAVDEGRRRGHRRGIGRGDD